MEEKLKEIIAFGEMAHGDQRRKYCDDRYMVHPIRVMRTCQKYSDDLSVLAAALLHDVLEDTPVTNSEIETFLKTILTEDEVKKAIKHIVDLTDVYTKKAYPKMNRRARKALEIERLSTIKPESQTIKYADILDNADEIVGSDPDFARVFLAEGREILQKMKNGNPDLREIALRIVEDSLEVAKQFQIKR